MQVFETLKIGEVFFYETAAVTTSRTGSERPRIEPSRKDYLCVFSMSG
jgi:hypothetical protein